jgi:cytochrome P450
MSEAVLDPTRLRRLFDLGGEVYASRGGGFDVDPYPTFNRLRDTGPVHQGTPHEALGWTGDVFFQGLPYPNRPHVTAYDYASCTEVLRNESRFVTNPPPLPGEPPLADAAILFMDGRRHHDYRTLVQPSFVPAKAVWWLENWIGGLVHRLIDGFEPAGAADLNIDFCAPIPMLTITGSFGIGIDEALDVREAVTADGQGGAALAKVLMPIIAARREEPRNDLISVLVQAELTDEDGVTHRLSDADVIAFSFLLLAAGSGTTWKQMGITLVALLQHPEALAAARDDRAFLRNVVEEALRWMPTDPVFARFAITDGELGGLEVPAGTVVHACLGAANRDPSRWERPDEFDPFRPTKSHLTFGHGPHTCLGMHVARAEIVHGIGALLDRLPNLRLDPDAPAPRIIGLYERGPDAVPVRFGGAR